MKSFAIPAGVLAALAAFSLWTGSFVEKHTGLWICQLEAVDDTARQEDWNETLRQLEGVYSSWGDCQTFFHTVMVHSDLDEAESLFVEALAVCAEEDGASLHPLLSRLIKQLELLSETHSASIKNIL